MSWKATRSVSPLISPLHVKAQPKTSPVSFATAITKVKTVISIEGNFEVFGARSALATFGRLDPAALGHGYLFTGPVGVGKKHFARELAHSLLCERPKSGVLGYCGVCACCRAFAAATNPDFVVSQGTIKIGKDGGSALHDEELSARDLVRELALRGYSGSRRIVLLGDVEEPPAGVVVILTSSASGGLLATIRSRFVEVPFAPLATDEVERILVAEGVPEERAHYAAEASLGSVVRARDVLEEGDESVRNAAFAWFESAARGEPGDASFLHLDDKHLTGAEKREGVAELIELVRLGLRDWAALTIAGANASSMLPDHRDRIAKLPKRDAAALSTVLGAVGETARLARSNVSPGLVVDYLRMQLAPPNPRM